MAEGLQLAWLQSRFSGNGLPLQLQVSRDATLASRASVLAKETAEGGYRSTSGDSDSLRPTLGTIQQPGTLSKYANISVLMSYPLLRHKKSSMLYFFVFLNASNKRIPRQSSLVVIHAGP